MPFYCCPPDVIFVTRGSKNYLFSFFDSLSSLDCCQWCEFWIYQSYPMGTLAIQSFDSRQERLFRKVTSVSIHSFVEWFDTFSYVLQPVDVTVKEVNHIRCFGISIAKYRILLSWRLTMERLWLLQLETALATFVTTWFTLAYCRWRSRYHSTDKCILNASRSLERCNGWFREQIGQRFTFFQFLSNDDRRCLKNCLYFYFTVILSWHKFLEVPIRLLK